MHIRNMEHSKRGKRKKLMGKPPLKYNVEKQRQLLGSYVLHSKKAL
jgi:hypothetical protein